MVHKSLKSNVVEVGNAAMCTHPDDKVETMYEDIVRAMIRSKISYIVG